MIKNDFKEFKKVFTIMAEGLSKEISPILIKIYFEAMSEFSIEKTVEVMKVVTLSCERWPVPAILRKLALNDKTKLLAEEAWLEVLSEKSRVCGRPGASPNYSTPEIEFSVRSIGGLNSIWQAGNEQESYYRHNFIQAYNNISQRADMDSLQGLPDRTEAIELMNNVKGGISAGK